MQKSLNQRINRLIINIVVLTTISLLVFIWKSTSDQATAQLSRDLQVAQNILTKVLDDKEALLETSTSLLTSDFGFKQVVASRDKATIESLLANHGKRINADLITLFTLSNEVITSVPAKLEANSVFVYPDLIQEAIDKGVSSSILSLDGQLYQVFFADVRAPRTIAVAMMGFKIDQSIAEQLKNITQLDTTISVNTDKRTYAISTLSKDDLAKSKAIEELNTLSWPILAISSSHDYISTSFVLIEKEDLRVDFILSNNVNAILSDFVSLQLSIGLIAVSAVVVAIFFGALLSKKLVQPIQTLTQHAKKIASGNYEAYTAVVGHSSELSTLSDAFNTMQTNIKDREDKVIYQAQHDLLTTLYNRNHVEKLLNEKFENNECFQAIGINIFGFRGINDTFGYDNGDICLETLAERVASLGGLSARLTGGELLWVPNEEVSLAELERIKQSLDGDVTAPGLNIPMKVAMGIINCPSDTHSPSELFRKMNIVIDEAQISRQFILPFSNELEEKYTRRLAIITELKKALAEDSDELALFYQPKLSLHSNKVETVEALIRWNNKALGFVSPEDFIAVAEHAGFIGEVTNWVFKRAIDDILSFKEENIDITVAINISAQDVMNPELLSMVLKLLKENSLPTSVLSFEMTEGQLVRNLQKAVTQLAIMRDAGFKIAIDDFGTGYSSLSYLSRLPADILKVDKSFVLKLDEQQSDQTIVKTVVKLAHDFNMEVVAEGVENEASLKLLTDYGCEFAQGYHICRPIDAQKYISWHKDYAASPQHS
ncbi:EAL domain-containing protein [Glaciecola sp. MH2013]|nr:EAL domain-containing protein [Glaciecola sp. MH2013]